MQKRSILNVFALNISNLIGIISSFGTIWAQYHRKDALGINFIGLGFAAWYLMFLFLIVKNFVILFRLKWQHYTIQSQWQRIINPTIIDELEKHNFYVRYYKQFGKSKECIPSFWNYFINQFHDLFIFNAIKNFNKFK